MVLEPAVRPEQHEDALGAIGELKFEGAPSPTRYLPQVLLATTLVAVAPLATSLALRMFGVLSSPWLAMLVAVALSFAASSAGNAYWRKHGAAGELVFSELLLWGWLRRWRQERQLADATTLLGLAHSESAHEEQALSVEERERLLKQLAGALEGQDLYLNGHSRRVARHAAMIARAMGLPAEEVNRIRAAAAVHDVGKLSTPKEILNKPGRLSDSEFDVIKRHPVDGADLVTALADPELTAIVRHHHERLDGKGYPDGLAGEDIPLGARIVAVADTFDAITSARAYRGPSRHDKAIDILRQEAGTQLDPAAVRAFLAYYSGNRPTVAWAVVTAALRRVLSWLSGDPAAAATMTAGKLAATTAATAAIGVAAAVPPVVKLHPAHPARVNHSVAAHVANAGRSHGTTRGTTGASGGQAGPTGTTAGKAKGKTARHQPGAHKQGKANGKAKGKGKAHKAPAKSNAHSGQAVPGAASGHPVSTNPAGHNNHASATGAAARSGAHPSSSSHPGAPADAGHGQGGGNGGTSSGHGNGGGSGSGHGSSSSHPSPPTSSASHGSSGGHAPAIPATPSGPPATPGPPVTTPAPPVIPATPAPQGGGSGSGHDGGGDNSSGGSHGGGGHDSSDSHGGGGSSGSSSSSSDGGQGHS